MNNQWKLVPTEATREILVAMLKANGHVNAYRDAIAAAVPPQDLKPFMYGIMQPDGKPHYSELCVSDEAHHLDDEVDSMNDGEELGYRVVGLYAQPDAGKVQRLRAERDALQLRLNEADQRIDELTHGHGEHVALMSVERSYDVRAQQILAFNTSKQGGGDLDDALGAAYKAALRYIPHPGEQPAPGSVVRPVDPERERLIEIIERYPNSDPLEYDAAVRKLQQ
ncbi:hypothetical protein EMIT0P100_10612 [Pseudomonas sp. IT-P100]|uniref:hypothetical protein n=1 Tax=Pseudomonas sp. IT-P100 TaxID=3026452 RepID=UPI0039E122F9